MAGEYAYIGLFLVLGILFVGSAFSVSWLLRPRAPSPAKEAPYECGEIVKGSSRVQFNVRYYLIALIFAVFDIELLFIIPWALVFPSMGPAAFAKMFVFILILVFGLVYAWKKGALEWL